MAKQALVIGDQAEIPPDVQQAFRRTGTTHILAISGMNFGIVASAAFVLFRWMLAFIHPILLTGWARKGAALLTLVPVSLYALLAGMSPSTQRALIMVTVFLLTFGLNFLWSIPSEDSWMMLLGIFGQSFVSTALLAASFVYYRDMSVWLQNAIEKLRPNVVPKV